MSDTIRLTVAVENVAAKQKELSREIAECRNNLCQLKVNTEKENGVTHIDECKRLIDIANQLIDQLKDLTISAQELIIQQQNLRTSPGRGDRVVDSGVFSANLENVDPATLMRETTAPRVASESATTANDDNSVGTDSSANSGFIAQCTGDSEA